MGARFKWLTESHSPRLRTTAESATEVSCCLEPHPCEVIRGMYAKVYKGLKNPFHS